MTAIYIIVAIIVRVLIIWWCVSEANKKGRDTTTAGILGLVCGLLAVLGYALVKSKVLPICPKCKDGTSLRVVVKGKDKGKKFYVCANYPQCEWRIRA